MIFCTIPEKDFTQFEQNNKYGNFFQSVPRANLRKKMKYITHLVGVKANKKVVAVALIVEKQDHEAWIQLGPILDYTNIELLDFFLKEVIVYAKAHGIVMLEIFPPIVIRTRRVDGSTIEEFDCSEIFNTFNKYGFQHEGFTIEIENKANRWMFVKDLSGLKNLRDAELTMNSSTRKKLHKTQREFEIKALKDKSELPEWRSALLDSNNRNHISTRDVKYFEDMWDAFGENIVFIEARRKDNNELVSSEVDIFHPNEMVAFVAGTIEKNKHFNGSTAIKGWNIEECLRRGQTRMNLYGMKGDFSANNPLLFFKNGLGGFTEEYIGGFRLVLNKKQLFINKVKRHLHIGKN